MRVDFVATERHYAAHLEPVRDDLALRGIDIGLHQGPGVPDDGTPTVIAAHGDLKFVPQSRPVALLEHGAGQTYHSIDHGGYSGGKDRERISLFLCPNETVADRNLTRYPAADVEVCGCPRLDRWVTADRLPERGVLDRPVVGMTWHWDCHLTHETRTAWTYYEAMIENVVRNYSVIAHAHPRLQERVEWRYRDLSEKFGRQFEWTEDPDAIFRYADVLCVDNSSLGFEFMAVTDRPVVWLNSPLYREGIEHGLRFWEWADSGVQVSHRADWVDGIRRGLEDQPAQKARRRECVQHVYGATLDGRAAERAGGTIIEWVKAHDIRYPVED